MSGFETDGELPILLMGATTMIVNKQCQPQNAEQQHLNCRCCVKTRKFLPKNVGNAIAESRFNKVKDKLPKDQMQKLTHFVHTARELTTQHTFAGVAQTRLRDPRGARPKVLMIQWSKVGNQELSHKMFRHLSSKIF